MSSQVDEYLKSDDSNKVGRLYVEVRYARDTSLSMPKNCDIFRLMKDGECASVLETLPPTLSPPLNDAIYWFVHVLYNLTYIELKLT